MHRRRVVLATAGAGALAVVLAYGLTHQGSAAPGVKGLDSTFHRYRAPALPDHTLAGRPFSLAALRGKPVVVNFWASWCPPCRAETPQIVQAAHDFAGRAAFVGVDVSDGKKAALAFARKHDISYPIVPDPSSAHALAYRAGGTPWTFILDRRGVVVDQLAGGTTARAIEAKLRGLA